MPFKILAFVLPLGLDTLAIAIALGLRGFRPWRPALLFTAFETLMPVFGIALARVVGRRFETATVVIGGMLLIAVGVHAVYEAFHGEDEADRVSFGSLRAIFLAGVAISTDELAAGFPLGVSGLPIGLVLLVIAVQTFLITTLGVTVGNRVRSGVARGASRYAGIAAGIVFALVGAWLIAERFRVLQAR
jgi:putative Mn2+ efflux pump MntP